VAPRPLTFHRPGPGGKAIEEFEPLAGVFGPVPEKGLQMPAYTWGPKDGGSGVRTTHLFQCPVSAIPAAVWELRNIWWDGRLLRLPPPKLTPLVRAAFVAFELEMQAIERRSANAMVAVAQAMGGGQK
jgi:hypothetical protein